MMSTWFSKHVEAWNKLIVKQKQNWALNWLIAKINMLSCMLILWGFCDKSGTEVRVYLIQDLHFTVIMEFDASHVLFIIHF